MAGVLISVGGITVKLDPDTKLGRLIGAMPSSAMVFEKLGIMVAGNEDRTLRQLCTEAGMSFDEFLRAMDEIDWEKETPQHNNSEASSSTK
jgi:hypothetical protein